MAMNSEHECSNSCWFSTSRTPQGNRQRRKYLAGRALVLLVTLAATSVNASGAGSDAGNNASRDSVEDAALKWWGYHYTISENIIAAACCKIKGKNGKNDLVGIQYFIKFKCPGANTTPGEGFWKLYPYRPKAEPTYNLAKPICRCMTAPRPTPSKMGNDGKIVIRAANLNGWRKGDESNVQVETFPETMKVVEDVNGYYSAQLEAFIDETQSLCIVDGFDPKKQILTVESYAERIQRDFTAEFDRAIAAVKKDKIAVNKAIIIWHKADDALNKAKSSLGKAYNTLDNAEKKLRAVAKGHTLTDPQDQALQKVRAMQPVSQGGS